MKVAGALAAWASVDSPASWRRFRSSSTRIFEYSVDIVWRDTAEGRDGGYSAMERIRNGTGPVSGGEKAKRSLCRMWVWGGPSEHIAKQSIVLNSKRS